jgi:Na+/pantothenate symporter
VIASTNLWPLIFGLYVKRTSKLAVLVSIITGSLTAVFWTWAKQPWGVHGFIAGSVVGLVVLLGLSLIQPARALRSEQ